MKDLILIMSLLISPFSLISPLILAVDVQEHILYLMLLVDSAINLGF